HAVPAGDLLPRRRAEAPRRGVEAEVGEGQALQAADRHADRRGRRLLAGRGLPPGLLQKEPAAVQVLRHRLRALRAPRPAVGRAATEIIISCAGPGPRLSSSPCRRARPASSPLPRARTSAPRRAPPARSCPT